MVHIAMYWGKNWISDFIQKMSKFIEVMLDKDIIIDMENKFIFVFIYFLFSKLSFFLFESWIKIIFYFLIIF